MFAKFPTIKPTVVVRGARHRSGVVANLKYVEAQLNDSRMSEQQRAFLLRKKHFKLTGEYKMPDEETNGTPAPDDDGLSPQQRAFLARKKKFMETGVVEVPK